MGQIFFEGHCLDIDRRELKRGSDLVPVEPQVFDLLAYLVQNRERVVTKDDLIAAVWDGRVISESTLTSRVNSARRAVGDSGGEQRLIRTYSRKGIRFVGTVQDSPDAPVAGPSMAAASAALSSKPCIAVMPFVNIGGDKDQEYFSDGITEDIITALSKSRSLLVLARNSSFAFRGLGGDVRRIGRDLGAGYLLQGSVRRMGPRVRITAQLVETEGGRNIWAEQYERPVEEIFAVQDDVTATIVARLEPEVDDEERQRTEQKPPNSFTAWDLHRLGTKHFYKSTAEDNRQAQRLFRRAIEQDPGFAAAHAFLSYAIVLDMIYFDQEPDDHRLDEAVQLARRAVALDDRDATVRFMYGRALLARKAYGEAIGQLEAAVELNPNLPVAYCGLGDSLAYEGRVADAIPLFQRAIDLSPRDPMRWAFYSYGALAYLFDRQFVLAEEWARKAAAIPNCHYWAYAHRAAALGYLEDADKRKAVLAELLRMKPQFNRKFAMRHLFYVKDPDQISIYLDGLRRCGIPEG